MGKIRVPYLDSKILRRISRYFIGIGFLLSKFFTKMDFNLKQSGIHEQYNITAREYLSFSFIVSTLVFILFSSFIFIVSGLLNINWGISNGIADRLIASFGIGAIAFMMIFFQYTYYPKMIVNRRIRAIDKNLLFALRTILINIRSGMPIFDSMVSIARGNYGEISEEFKNIIEKVKAGKPISEALEELAIRNPSNYLRRALWQLSNAIKSGSDVGENLETVIKALSKEQLIQIRQYQSTLNPLSMMYMMVAVIMPSLGITIMIVLSSFPGMSSLGDEKLFWVILLATCIMQVMFMFIIRAKRPSLMG